MKFATIGIIGLGSFGQLVGRYASRWGEVRYYDAHNPEPQTQGLKKATLGAVSQCDIVFFCVPLQAYEDLLPRVATELGKDSIFVDIASVKTEPQRLLAKYLPGHQHIVLSHPLFGPQSAWDSLEGHKFIVCETRGYGFDVVEFLGRNLGLHVIHKTVEEHDQAMARVQGLTFFLARALDEYGLNGESTGLETPTYSWLKGLAELDQHHSDDLLNTIESHNPYAAKVRSDILRILNNLDKKFTR